MSQKYRYVNVNVFHLNFQIYNVSVKTKTSLKIPGLVLIH